MSFRQQQGKAPELTLPYQLLTEQIMAEAARAYRAVESSLHRFFDVSMREDLMKAEYFEAVLTTGFRGAIKKEHMRLPSPSF